MSFVNGIRNFINPTLLLDGRTLPGEAECQDVAIKGSYVIIQTDHNDFKHNVLNTLFAPGAIRAISDYVIISDSLILICEMKSNNEGSMRTQLKNTGKIIKYILSIIGGHSNIAIPIPPIKYVCFANMYKGYKLPSKQGRLTSITWGEGELFKLPCNSNYLLSQFI